MGKPKIRFKGFTEAWEQRKLGEVVSVCSGKDYKHLDEGNIPVYGTGGYMLSVSEALSNDSDAIGIGRKGTIDKPYILKAPFWTVDTLFYCIPHEKNDLSFVFSTFQNINWKAMDESTGVPSLSKTAINCVDVIIPSFEEQEKIGCYFSNLDHLITLHQRKCDETKKLKKYMLQKMFPQNGMKVPEIRFEGFTGDWEQRKLIDVCDYVDYRGKTPTKIDCGIFLVTAKNVKAGYIDYESSKEYISEDNYEEVMHRGKPKIGDVLITTEAPCGNVAQVDSSNIALAQRIIKYRGHKNEIDNTYLKHYMLAPHFQKLLFEKSSGGTVQGIKGSILHQQYVMYPRYAEQVKIGQYLDTLDHLITLHQRKRDELVKIKKYMLQNMFV